MGRRKRRNSDVDISVEESYRCPLTSFGKRQKQDDSVTEERVEESDCKSSSQHQKQENQATEISKAKPSAAVKDDSSPDTNVAKDNGKIEELRKKKQQRKERKKAKQAEKAEHAELLKKSQQEQAAKFAKEKQKKQASTETSGNTKFITIQKGVQFQDVIIGKGPVVEDRKKIRVAYTLRAKHKTGKILDSSNNFGFRLGRGEVIQGWDIGVKGMRHGGRRYLIVPPGAGYGSKNIGAGPGAVLFFDVTLLPH